MAQPELVTTSGGREIKDYIDTYDCIMAGDLVPIWRSGKKNRLSWNGHLRMEAYALCGMDSNLG